MMTDFVDILIAKCERGPGEHTIPAQGEWEANFSFVFSPVPEADWWRLFKEVTNDDKLSKLKWKGVGKALSSWSGNRYTITCHPDQLQRYADLLKTAIVRTNQYRRDMVQAGSSLETRRKEFEEAITSALAGLEL